MKEIEYCIKKCGGKIVKMFEKEIWIDINKNNIRKLINNLKNISFPFLSGISANDYNNYTELIYHVSIFMKKEILLNIKVKVYKKEYVINTITDIVPGAEIAEREKREMLGIDFDGLKNKENVFLSKSIKIKPWRKENEL